MLPSATEAVRPVNVERIVDHGIHDHVFDDHVFDDDEAFVVDEDIDDGDHLHDAEHFHHRIHHGNLHPLLGHDHLLHHHHHHHHPLHNLLEDNVHELLDIAPHDHHDYVDGDDDDDDDGFHSHLHGMPFDHDDDDDDHHHHHAHIRHAEFTGFSPFPLMHHH
ncbi:Uncharacterized protein PBTT_09803 [Plasmodiophora brassicae]